jgi:hypothetical protein
MDQAFLAQLAAMKDEIQAAALPEGCKHTASWCLGQLPALYGKFRQSSERRYVEEIVRLVRGVLQELANSEKACPAARPLAASIAERLGLLHEQFGLPGLNLKLPRAAASRARTTRSAPRSPSR